VIWLVTSQDKAISEHLSGQLLITGASDLWALMDAIRYLAREPTEERLLQGFKLLCEKCMPEMDITDATRQSVITYLQKFWLAPKWREACEENAFPFWYNMLIANSSLVKKPFYAGTDWGRANHNVPFFMSCNNALERYWQEFKKDGTRNRILKRFDELIERVSGYGLHGLSPMPSVMDAAALHARDHNALDFSPRIATDVRRRHHLANCILISEENPIRTVVEGKVYAVRASVAPSSVLNLDLKDEREMKEETQTARSQSLLEPLYQHLCGPVNDVIAAAGASAPSYPHYLIDWTRTPPACSCRDHCRRGGQRGEETCPHLLSARANFPHFDRARKSDEKSAVR
jgi:hypothetical protein